MISSNLQKTVQFGYLSINMDHLINELLKSNMSWTSGWPQPSPNSILKTCVGTISKTPQMFSRWHSTNATVSLSF